MKRRLKSGAKSGDLAKVVEKRNTDYDFPTPNKFVGAENNKVNLMKYLNSYDVHN